MPLSDVAIKNARAAPKPYKLADAGGLYLLVTPTHSKLWRFDYRFAGKRKTLAVGPYPQVKLIDARDERDAAKRSLRAGVDPSEQRRERKAERNAAVRNTFAMVAKRWFDAREGGWTEGYRTRVWSRIEADIIPQIGDRSVAAIDTRDLS